MALGLGNNLIRSGGAGNADKLSLDLQFAADKTLTARKGPTPTFLRASAATQVNAAGLIEWAPENLMLNSGNVSLMSRLNVPVAISQTGGPLGSYYTLGVNAINDFHIYRNSGVTPAASASSMMWVLAKRGTARYLRMGGGSASTFDWDALTFSSVSTTHSAGDPVAVGDGWYWLPILRGLTEFIDLAPSSSSGVAFNYNETANVTVEVAAIQVSRSALLQNVAPTYIPTTTAAVYGARFDHDPLTQACKGLLIEEQRINSFLQSDNFASASWTQSLLTVSNNVTSSPDGSTSGDLITEDSTTGIHQINQPSPIITAGQAYTLSVFAKAASHNCFQISFPAIYGSGLFCNFILSGSGSLGNKDATSVARIESYPNGWYRCSLTAPSVVGGSASPVAILAINNNSAAVRNTSYLGTGAQVVSLWGAQLEAGAFPTSYIPTTTGPVTRSADTCSITGSAFSGVYNQPELTVFCEYYSNPGSLPTAAIGLSNATTAERINIGHFSVPFRNAGFVVDDGTTQAAPSFTANPNQLYKAALGSKINSFQFAVNGALATKDTIGTMPNITELNIGKDWNAVFQNNSIKAIRLYKKQLSDAKLQTLTT